MEQVVIDMMGRKVLIPKQPMRIISLVPSQTELLYDLGLGDAVVGITKFCIHPEEWFRTKTRIGGTKQLNLEQIKALKPDLIIGNKEENTQADIEALAQIFPVWMSDILTYEDALEAILQIGMITQKQSKAQEIVDQISIKFGEITSLQTTINAGYFIWHQPDMVAARDTFIDSIMEKLGLQNAFKHMERYPAISHEAITSTPLDVIFLSSEPYPFADKHIAYYQKLSPHAKVKLVDGEYFSWYGSRLLKAPIYFKALLNELAQ